jgi:hypothetical protein
MDTFKKYLESRRDRCKKIIDSFGEEFRKHPVHALEWSGDVFRAAAEEQVTSQILFGINDGRSLAELTTFTIDEALRLSSGQGSSTSPVSNHIAKCVAAAWADMAVRLRGGLF